MILEYLNFALVCLAVFFLTIIFSFYRSSRYRIFDNKNFSKNFFNSLFMNQLIQEKGSIYAYPKVPMHKLWFLTA